MIVTERTRERIARTPDLHLAIERGIFGLDERTRDALIAAPLGIGIGCGLPYLAGPSGLNFSAVTGYRWELDADAAYITLNGSNVSQWSDKSGNGLHIVQATGALQPPWLSSLAALGGKPAVDFQNAHRLQGTWLHSTSNTMTVSAYTMYMVVVVDAIDTNSGTIFNNDAIWSGPNNALFGTHFTSATPNVIGYNFDTNADGATLATTTGVAKVFCQSHDAGNIVIYDMIAGTSASTASGNTANVADVMRVGANFNAAAYFDGKIGGMSLFNVTHDSTTRAMVLAEYRRRYSI